MSAKPYPDTSRQKITRRTRLKEKTAEQLIDELAEIRQRIASLEDADRDRNGKVKASKKSKKQAVAQYSSTPIASYTWQKVGGDFVLVDFNDTAVEITDGQIVSLVGKTAKELNGHEPAVLEDLSQCFAKRSSIKRELDCRFNSIGEDRYLAINSSFVLPNLVLVQIEDITERRQAEEAILRAKKEWERALDSVPELVAIIDDQHRIVRVNKSMADCLELSPSECVGLNCYDAVHGMDSPPPSCPHVQSLKDNSSHTAEFDEDRLGGQFEITTSPLTGPDGCVIGCMHIARKCGTRKDSNEVIVRLSRELATLDAIAEVASQSFDIDEILNNALEKVSEVMGVRVGGVYLLDKDTKNLNVKVVTGVNDDTYRVISPIKIGKGVSGRVVQSGEPMFIESLPDSVDLIGKRALRMVIDEQLKAAMCIPLKARGRVLGVMYVMTDNDRTLTQQERTFLVRVSRQISSAIDASEMNKEISKVKAADELERLRMAFLASISHEIRTPLASIKGFASTLLQTDVQWDAETQKDFIRHIDEESDRLMRIVNDVLDVSRISCGAMRLEKTMALFDDVLEDVRNKLRILTKNHHLKLQKPAVSPLIMMDGLRIGQVITNLVENAASYSLVGSEITLAAEVREDKLIVSVTDKGSGIAKEYQEKVFDRFFRLEESAKRRKKGSGLGLAICKGIIEGHGGEIWVESKYGKGSKFIFTLPIVDDSEL